MQLRLLAHAAGLLLLRLSIRSRRLCTGRLSARISARRTLAARVPALLRVGITARRRRGMSEAARLDSKQQHNNNNNNNNNNNTAQGGEPRMEGRGLRWCVFVLFAIVQKLTSPNLQLPLLCH